MKIILASNSPRRKQLLSMIGLKFVVEPSNFKETASKRLSPQERAEFLSFQKAQSVAVKHKNALVIGADTIVVLGKSIIGKPKNKVHAKRMLKKLNGKMHKVITAYSLINTETKRQIIRSIESKVYFKKLKDIQIDHYIKTGEYVDKAGAYGVQGIGSLLVRKIDGDYFNVVGLPIQSLVADLEKLGVMIL